MERHLKKCNKIPNQLATGEKAANWQSWRRGGNYTFQWGRFAKICGDDGAQRFAIINSLNNWWIIM
jgi:hypothetical protein